MSYRNTLVPSIRLITPFPNETVALSSYDLFYTILSSSFENEES